MFRFTRSLALLGLLAACSGNPAAPKPKPHPDPYEIAYIVDTLSTYRPLWVKLTLTDSSQGVFNTVQDNSPFMPDSGRNVECLSVSDTLGQRLWNFTAAYRDSIGDTLVAFHLGPVDPAAGVDTTGGVGLSPAQPWIWQWTVGDSVLHGYPRPTTWNPSFCNW